MISKKATITVVAKEDIKDASLTVKISSSSTVGMNTSISGVVTSTVITFSKKYFPEGTKMVTGTSEGKLTIYNKTSAPLTLIPKTRFLTKEGILFRLKNRTTVPANSNIVAEVYADKSGKESDIEPTHFTLPGLPSERESTIYADSSEPMRGGENKLGVLSEEDLASAKVSYNEDLKKDFLINQTENFQDYSVLMNIVDQKVAADQNIGTETTEFTLSGTSTLVYVLYDPKELNQIINNEVGKTIDPEVDKVLPGAGNPEVSIGSYNLNENSANLAITQKLTVTIDASSEKLAPTHFVGMKREDIEKYITGLDHVAGVEVKFSPVWIKSAPDTSDKIKVVVKNIE